MHARRDLSSLACLLTLSGLSLACAEPTPTASDESSDSESSATTSTESSQTSAESSAATETTDASETAEAPETETESETGDPPGDDELCEGVTPSQLPTPRGTSPGAESPFDAVNTNDAILGALVDPGAVEASIGPGAVDTSFDLDLVGYDVHVPPNYDGTAPFGLIAFINSGNNGSLPGSGYPGLLEDQQLIWVAPNDAGNQIPVSTRMGLAYLGTVRAMELFNIDPSRVYAMGSSGGGRSASMLAYQYPQLYTGTLARCGANYPAEVEQAYETQDPDSHYEYWGPAYFPDVGGEPYLEHLRSFERPVALMTSFDDFREGDMMNIYHHGFEADDLIARFIETSGGHCSSNAAHLRDGLGFVDHPLWRIVEDGFDDGALGEHDGLGDGLVDISGPGGAALEQDGALVLDASGGPAAALVRNRSHWHDRHGMIVRVALDLSLGEGDEWSLGVSPYDDALHGGPDLGSTAPVHADELGSHPGIFVRLVAEQGAVSLVLDIHAPGQGFAESVVIGALATDPGELDLKLELWDRELQLDLGPLAAVPMLVPGVRVLDDERTVRVRWDELMGPQGWPADAWPLAAGCVVSCGLRGEAGAIAQIDSLRMEDAVGFACR